MQPPPKTSRKEASLEDANECSRRVRGAPFKLGDARQFRDCMAPPRDVHSSQSNTRCTVWNTTRKGLLICAPAPTRIAKGAEQQAPLSSQAPSESSESSESSAEPNENTNRVQETPRNSVAADGEFKKLRDEAATKEKEYLPLGQPFIAFLEERKTMMSGNSLCPSAAASDLQTAWTCVSEHNDDVFKALMSCSEMYQVKAGLEWNSDFKTYVPKPQELQRYLAETVFVALFPMEAITTSDTAKGREEARSKFVQRLRDIEEHAMMPLPQERTRTWIVEKLTARPEKIIILDGTLAPQLNQEDLATHVKHIFSESGSTILHLRDLLSQVDTAAPIPRTAEIAENTRIEVLANDARHLALSRVSRRVLIDLLRIPQTTEIEDWSTNVASKLYALAILTSVFFNHYRYTVILLPEVQLKQVRHVLHMMVDDDTTVIHHPCRNASSSQSSAGHRRR